jgi:formyltetrahydrofolate-dependent phosphoribosylglycinamide formyltransferase
MSRARVGILLSGRGPNLASLIEAAGAADCPYEVVLVLSDNPDAPGLDRARALGVDARAIDRRLYGKDREAHERIVDDALREAGVEYVALAGYMRILTPFLVGAWEGRMVNIHPSLLPKYPGLDTHRRAIETRDAEAGCTVHLVTNDLDCGPVLGQARVPVLPGDDEAALAQRVLVEEHRLYPAALAELVRRGGR